VKNLVHTKSTCFTKIYFCTSTKRFKKQTNKQTWAAVSGIWWILQNSSGIVF